MNFCHLFPDSGLKKPYVCVSQEPEKGARSLGNSWIVTICCAREFEHWVNTGEIDTWVKCVCSCFIVCVVVEQWEKEFSSVNLFYFPLLDLEPFFDCPNSLCSGLVDGCADNI